MRALAGQPALVGLGPLLAGAAASPLRASREKRGTANRRRRRPPLLAADAAAGARMAGPLELPGALLAGMVDRAPPPELQALLDWVAAGQPLDLFRPT